MQFKTINVASREYSMPYGASPLEPAIHERGIPRAQHAIWGITTGSCQCKIDIELKPILIMRYKISRMAYCEFSTCCAPWGINTGSCKCNCKQWNGIQA
eukprot:1153332-Pelagomonas_calceolata.AAC.3